MKEGVFKRWQVPSLTAGALFMIQALVCRNMTGGGNFSASLCTLGALAVLVPHLAAIVVQDWRTGRRHMNELVLIAVAAAAARGDFQGLMTGAGIAFVLLIGLMIENSSARGASESLSEITRLTEGETTLVEEDGRERNVHPSELFPGAVLRLRPGDVVPADGEILSGFGAFQEANITGESLPVEKNRGDTVFAGTVNLSGAVLLKVTRIGAQTAIGKVRELILKAEATRPVFIRMIDAYAKFYTPMVLVCAFLIWAVFDHDWNRVVTVLVAACPIALVLSTPSAAVAALSAAAKLGILIKSITDIERFGLNKVFIFDKTGTLTEGRLEVVMLSPSKVESEVLLQAAAVAGQNSHHPVSKAVCALAEKVHLNIPSVTDFRETPGRGIVCRLGETLVYAGNLAWQSENGISENAFSGHEEVEHQGLNLLYISKGGEALGWIGLSDPVRDEAREVVQALKTDGCSVMMVTGDRESVARTVGQQVGIDDIRSHCKPEEKVRCVESLEGKVVFVGDGVNDGPALSSAEIGVAMGAAGSHLAVESASIALMNNRLSLLLDLRSLSGFYRHVMVENLVIGILIIVSGVLTGLLLPRELSDGGLGAFISASLQLSGAVAVTLNSARLLRFRTEC